MKEKIILLCMEEECETHLMVNRDDDEFDEKISKFIKSHNISGRWFGVGEPKEE